MKSQISYKAGYKYQLFEDYFIGTNILPENDIDTKYIRLNKFGHLSINEGYAWDGATNPAIDSKNFMRGSLVHDAFYQLIREGHLNVRNRNKADRLLQALCVEDGMWRIRAWWVYKATQNFGGFAIKSKKKILTAP